MEDLSAAEVARRARDIEIEHRQRIAWLKYTRSPITDLQQADTYHSAALSELYRSVPYAVFKEAIEIRDKENDEETARAKAETEG